MATRRPWPLLPAVTARSTSSSRRRAPPGGSSPSTRISRASASPTWATLMERTSSASSPKLSARDAAILLVAAALGAAIYLLVSARIYRVGFPLDDSWIHLTYARNLALRGEWAFQPGRLSAGSTAPLWPFLLGLGFWLHLGPYAWTYLLGELSLLGLALLAEHTARAVVANYQPRLPWI